METSWWSAVLLFQHACQGYDMTTSCDPYVRFVLGDYLETPRVRRVRGLTARETPDRFGCNCRDSCLHTDYHFASTRRYAAIWGRCAQFAKSHKPSFQRAWKSLPKKKSLFLKACPLLVLQAWYEPVTASLVICQTNLPAPKRRKGALSDFLGPVCKSGKWLETVLLNTAERGNPMLFAIEVLQYRPHPPVIRVADTCMSPEYGHDRPED